jgi:beta-xylosidase
MPGTHQPVFPGVFADPHITVFDDTFYIYPTTDGFPNWGGTAFSVFSSKNLIEWTKGPVLLDAAKDLTWAKGRAWAPAIARVGDTYYFYFSAEVQLGVATSKSPSGPFKDALGVPLVKAAQYSPQSIDPYVFTDDDGSNYLLFGSGGSGLRMAKLKADMVSFANTPANISPSGASGTLEGSGMFKRKGSYYLYWSEGNTLDAGYKMAYARASSVSGPFTRLGTILAQDTTLKILGSGGGTILAIPSRDEHYIAYHRFKIPGGDGTNRETCIDRLSFNSDGTIAPVKPTLEGLQTAVQP